MISLPVLLFGSHRLGRCASPAVLLGRRRDGIWIPSGEHAHEFVHL